jgi:hypothetical protein
MAGATAVVIGVAAQILSRGRKLRADTISLMGWFPYRACRLRRRLLGK